MQSCPYISRCLLSLTFLIASSILPVTYAYKPLVDSFLQNLSSGGSDFDPVQGRLLGPILTSRVPGTTGHSAVQQHFVNFFNTELPKWTIEWHNSSTKTPTGAELSIANLVFQREPPWTKPGQANFLTLAAHYDSKSVPDGYVGAADGAVPCAILMHVARSIDRYVTQMHDEMAELGEGGTVEMDMGVQVMFVDGKESFDGSGPVLYGSRALSESWEKNLNPVGSKYHTTLGQISMFVMLDFLGTSKPVVPSYLPVTHWAYNRMANLESRLRANDLLETKPPSPFLSETSGPIRHAEAMDDHVPFGRRGVPYLHLLTWPLTPNRYTMADKGKNLDLSVTRDWAKIVTGFALEWLDMMEVWPE